MVSWGVGAWWFPYYGLYYPNISKYDWGFIPNYPLIHMNKPGSNQVVELFELPTIPNQPGYFEQLNHVSVELDDEGETIGGKAILK